ncbi:hypothetical protein ABZS66_01085 [Dactylosporangium sp. NPDC005572]
MTVLVGHPPSRYEASALIAVRVAPTRFFERLRPRRRGSATTAR